MSEFCKSCWDLDAALRKAKRELDEALAQSEKFRERVGLLEEFEGLHKSSARDYQEMAAYYCARIAELEREQDEWKTRAERAEFDAERTAVEAERDAVKSLHLFGGRAATLIEAARFAAQRAR